MQADAADRPLFGLSGRSRFAQEVVGASDLSVRSRKISDGAFDPLPSVAPRKAVSPDYT